MADRPPSPARRELLPHRAAVERSEGNEEGGPRRPPWRACHRGRFVSRAGGGLLGSGKGAAGRVEAWRGGLGAAYRSGPFGCRGFTSRALPRFHSPLIEPDRRVSRIRLPDKDSCLRPQEAGLRKLWEPHQSQFLAQVAVRIACSSRTLHSVLPAQPLAEPMARVRHHVPVGRPDPPQAEVVRPPHQLAVEAADQFPGVEPGPLPAQG
jgi:hypothetical protein